MIEPIILLGIYLPIILAFSAPAPTHTPTPSATGGQARRRRDLPPAETTLSLDRLRGGEEIIMAGYKDNKTTLDAWRDFEQAWRDFVLAYAHWSRMDVLINWLERLLTGLARKG